MSAVHFHSLGGRADLQGSERAWLSTLCRRLFVGAVSVGTESPLGQPHPIKELLSLEPGMLSLRDYEWRQALDGLLMSPREDLFIRHGEMTIDLFSLAMNTALRLGGDEIKLAARLHSHCESHLYVEGPNRSWLAAIIRRGRENNIFRAEVGWGGVIDFLESSTDGPVVLSDSRNVWFPNRPLVIDAGLWAPANTEAEDEELWDRLSDDEQWRLGINAVRMTDWLELKPETWGSYHLVHDISVFDLMEGLAPVSS